MVVDSTRLCRRDGHFARLAYGRVVSRGTSWRPTRRRCGSLVVANMRLSLTWASSSSTACASASSQASAIRGCTCALHPIGHPSGTRSTFYLYHRDCLVPSHFELTQLMARFAAIGGQGWSVARPASPTSSTPIAKYNALRATLTAWPSRAGRTHATNGPPSAAYSLTDRYRINQSCH